MTINLDAAEMLEVFGDADPEQHAAEAEQRWGGTDPWRESQRRTSSYGKADWLTLKAEAAAVEVELADAMRNGVAPTSERAMAAAERHRRHICRWFYECSPELHAALGRMYVDDERFAAHYDAHVPGLAAYVAAAVQANAERVTGTGE
jgi:hypothetical protein